MRKLIVAATALALVEFPTTAHADEVDDLVARGEELAKQGEWTQAIIAFKAADAQRPRAKHACLIGLAYTRRELWPQAEVFFGRCRARISADDPAPDWLSDAESTLAEKLTTSNAAAVTITVTPPTALALVSVSAFAPDETFSPRTIHLAPGTYTITVSAPNHTTANDTIVIDGSSRELPVTIALAPIGERRPPPVVRRASRVPTYVMIAGGLLVGTGIAYHVLVARPARDDLDGASTHAGYDAQYQNFLDKRAATIGFYTTGAIVALTGLVLRYTVFRERAVPVDVGVATSGGSAMVTVGWQR